MQLSEYVIVYIFHFSSFFKLKRLFVIHLQVQRTRKVLYIQLVYHISQLQQFKCLDQGLYSIFKLTQGFAACSMEQIKNRMLPRINHYLKTSSCSLEYHAVYQEHLRISNCVLRYFPKIIENIRITCCILGYHEMTLSFELRLFFGCSIPIFKVDQTSNITC